MPTYFQVTQPGKGTFLFICKKKYNNFVCDAENAFNRMCPFNGTVAWDGILLIPSRLEQKDYEKIMLVH
jgi:hypothetical protein